MVRTFGPNVLIAGLLVHLLPLYCAACAALSIARHHEAGWPS